MRTRLSSSMVRALASALDTSSWTRIISLIWLPMVWTGDIEVIGSWKIIEMYLPRIARICLLLGSSLAMSTVRPSLKW